MSIAPQVQLSKFNLERIEVEQASNQRLAYADDQLDGLNCLQQANDPRQNAEHARLRAVRDCVWRRRLWKKAPVARPAQVRRKHSRLPLEPEYRAVHVGFSGENTDVVRKIARSEIIRAVHNNVVFRHNLGSVFAGETALMQFDTDLGVDVAEPVLCRF